MHRRKTSRKAFLSLAGSTVGLGLLSALGCAPAALPTVTPAPAAIATTAPAVAPTKAPAAAATPAATAALKPAPATTTTAAGAPKRGGTLIAAGTGDIKFDPYFQIRPLLFAYSQFYNALFDYRGPDPTKADRQLADSWQETDKSLTIKLRPGVKFHTGREITSQDVVDNIARAKDKSIGHFLFSSFDAAVDSAEAIDPSTVKINYKKTYPVKLDDLANLFLIPKEAMAEIGAKPVGSGPFRFVDYAPGDKLEMVRFDQYWEKDKPYLDKVTIKIIADGQARLANLLGGAVDVVDGIEYPDVARLKNDDKIQIVSLPPGGGWFANIFNTAKKPFDNKLVRQAMNYSVDREKIAKLAYFGLLPVTQSRYLPDHFWYSEKAGTMYKFDLSRAKALLEQAGYPSGFETSIVVNESVITGSKAMAQVWAQDLAKIGVKLAIEEREQGPFYDLYFKGDYNIQSYSLGDGRFDPATELAGASATRVTDNKANIQTLPFFEEYKKLIGEGANSIDPAVRKRVYDKIQEIIAEESWMIILAFRVNFIGLSKRVKGFRPVIAGGHYLGNVWIEG